MKLTRRFVVCMCCLLCAVLLRAEEKRPAITGVAFGRFFAADAAASERFYAGMLGLTKISVGKTTVYPVDSSQWIETVPLPSAELTSRMDAVGFTTRDAAGLLRYLKAKGFAIEQPLRDGMFAIRDPEGYQVWFVQTGANKLVAQAKPSPHAASRRLIHVGFVVRDGEKERAFYEGVLGFHLYWKGGKTDAVDWMSLQVPEGTDWLECMMNVAPNATLKTVGVMDHVALGTAEMPRAVAILKANGCADEVCDAAKFGRDGKVQLNLYDPDLTRVEMMEFKPSREPCCSPVLGKTPSEAEDR